MTRFAALMLFLTLGVLLTLGGGILGFTPISQGGASCGSAFHPDNISPASHDYVNAVEGRLTTIADQCTSAASNRKTVALAVGVPGIACLLVAGGLTLAELEARTKRQPATRSGM
jgi:hypothetical protein